MSKNNPAAAEFGRPNSGASMATATKAFTGNRRQAVGL
jgi:hypothetical protein